MPRGGIACLLGSLDTGGVPESVATANAFLPAEGGESVTRQTSERGRRVHQRERARVNRDRLAARLDPLVGRRPREGPSRGRPSFPALSS